MRNPIILTVGLASVVTLALTLPHDAGAREAPKRTVRPQSESFCFSALYSGPLSGELVINGVGYQVSEKATIYEVGNGLLTPGTGVRDRMICLSGSRRGDRLVISSISVRPVGNSSALAPAGAAKEIQGERPR